MQGVVIEWVTVITTDPISGVPSVNKGSRHWTLANGAGVNYVDVSEA